MAAALEARRRAQQQESDSNLYNIGGPAPDGSGATSGHDYLNSDNPTYEYNPDGPPDGGYTTGITGPGWNGNGGRTDVENPTSTGGISANYPNQGIGDFSANPMPSGSLSPDQFSVPSPQGSTGYLSSQPNTSMPGTRLVNQNQFQPTERGFDSGRYGMSDDQTVEHRLAGILAKDSPLMQRAATQGMQYANGRGMLNSSMAAGAAQGAMIDRATPIAQQDAQQAFQRQNLSLDHQNTRELAYIQDDLQRNQLAMEQAIKQGNTQLATELQMVINDQKEHLKRGSMELGHQQTLQRDKFQADTELGRMGYANNLDMNKMGYAHNLGLANQAWASQLDEASRSRLMDLEAQYSRMLNFDAQSASAYEHAMKALGLLNTNPQMSEEQQKAGSAQIIGMMDTHLEMLEGLYS